LLDELFTYDDPLIQRKAVHHDERSFVLLGIADVSGEKTGDMVEHDRRNRRQIDQTRVALFQPSHKGCVDLGLQRPHLLARRFRQHHIRFQGQGNKLRPGLGEMEPVIVPRVLCRDRGRYGVEQTVHTEQSIHLIIGTDTDGQPSL